MTGPIERVLGPALGVSPATLRLVLRPAMDHQSNRLYDLWASGRRLIVKEYLKPDEFAVAPVREHRALRLLASFDIAPQPVYVYPTAGPDHGPLVVYEWLTGDMWNRRRPTATDLGRLAELWLATQSVTAACDWHARGSERTLAEAAAEFADLIDGYATWTETAFPAGRRAAALATDLLRRRQPVVDSLAADVPALRFCRSDQRFANVIARPDGRLGLVDWEDSGLRDPARDVADLLNHANQEDLLSWDDWQAFLIPYLAAQRATDPDLEDRVRRYLAIFPMYWLSVLLDRGMRHAREGTLVGWTINGLPANDRLRRYLARGLAWPATEFDRELDRLAGVSFFPIDPMSAPTPGGGQRP
jgi:aminoglycoside phosphotransferase (APT) family kinase protein